MNADVTMSLPTPLVRALDHAADEWAGAKVARFWQRDPTLWTGGDEDQWLGWLDVVDAARAEPDLLARVTPSRLGDAMTHVLVLGMGGSSLCPEVLSRSFGRVEGAPRLMVLDSTDPAQVRAVEHQIDLERTVFIVSSKSGTTLETRILMEYFLDRVGTRLSDAEVGQRFVAVTDPGSTLETRATELGFRHVFHGIPSIGGRYSALSHFGMVPAGAMGLDVERLRQRADAMRSACAATRPVRGNPGVMLGLVLGVAARQRRDKVTLIISPSVRDLGAWIEQLVAESTGKEGKGLIPIDGERVAEPRTYGTDRLFVYIRHRESPDVAQDGAVSRLAEAGLPVVRLELGDRYDLGAEFYRWEVATAVAGAVLQVHPFNQPDVEASKVETRQLMTAFERDGQLPAEVPLVEDRTTGLAVFASEGYRTALGVGGADTPRLGDIIKAHCGRIDAGDYVAFLAYVEMKDTHAAVLETLRHTVRETTGSATCVGFGPRFLHSTGQVYKGGPNSGVFFQITADDAEDVPVPGHRYTFGIVKAAQAAGDLAVLAERDRRVIRLHISGGVHEGLERIASFVREACVSS